MKINLYSNKTYLNQTPNFKGFVSKTKNLKDVFSRNQFLSEEKKSISRISNIKPIIFAGTSCAGSIPLQNFWKFFKFKNPKLKSKYFGLSTNKDGYADSFLKEKSNIPLSTSFVHDCSALYLYNEKTKTHALYHAAPDCKEGHLKFIIEKLMPEGVTKAAIVPGDYVFYKKHYDNMHNMFYILKGKNPNIHINVYHDSTRFPEIVGYKGKVYEIPNKNVKKQMKEHSLNVVDNGQASFKILDLQSADTFFEIYSRFLSEKNMQSLRTEFQQKKLPPLISEIFEKEISAIETVLNLIKKIDSLDDLNFLQTAFPYNKFKLMFSQKKEELLMNELQKINDEKEMKIFYQKARPELMRVKNLLALFNQKKHELL